MLQKQIKSLLKQIKHKSYTNNMIAKFEIDAIKIYEQMRLKMAKKLRTAGLDSNFLLYERKCIREGLFNSYSFFLFLMPLLIFLKTTLN